MVDRRLRSLEREAGDDPAGRARRARERLRAGLLDPDRVALLALLGDGAARAALGEVAPAPVELLEDLIETLVLAGAPLQVRVGASAAREALAAHAIEPAALARAEAALSAAEAWLDCPCEAHRSAAARHWIEHLDGEPLTGPVEAQVAAFLAAQQAGSPATRAQGLERLLRHAARALELDGPGLARRLAERLSGWALGE